MPRLYKQLIIAAGSLVAALLLGFLLYKMHQYDELHPQKYICTDWHEDMQLMPVVTTDAKGNATVRMQMMPHSECVKHGINPKWNALNG